MLHRTRCHQHRRPNKKEVQALPYHRRKGSRKVLQHDCTTSAPLLLLRVAAIRLSSLLLLLLRGQRPTLHACAWAIALLCARPGWCHRASEACTWSNSRGLHWPRPKPTCHSSMQLAAVEDLGWLLGMLHTAWLHNGSLLTIPLLMHCTCPHVSLLCPPASRQTATYWNNACTCTCSTFGWKKRQIAAGCASVQNRLPMQVHDVHQSHMK